MSSLPPIPRWMLSATPLRARYRVVAFTHGPRWRSVCKVAGYAHWGWAIRQAQERFPADVPVAVLDCAPKAGQPIAWTNTAAHGTVLEGDA